MATPTLGGTPTSIALANGSDSGTWTLLTTVDTDLKKEGSGSRSGILRMDLAEGYYTLASGSVNLTGQHVRVWINFSTVAYLDTEAGSGMEFLMYDGTNTAYWVAFGSDTYAGGWKNYVLNCDSSPASGSYNKAAVTRWGFRFNRTGIPANKINTWVDYVRYGDGYYATGGTSGDEILLAGINVLDETAGYGILLKNEGVYFCYGALTIGNGSTTTWFKMLNQVLVFPDSPVASGLYKLVGAGSGCRVTIDGSALLGGSTDATRFIFDMDDADLVSCSITGCLLTRSGEVRAKSGQTWTANNFINCGQILAAGANFSGGVVSGYEGTSDTGALIWNVATDPDGYLDDMEFTKGTASTHAIEFGLTSPTSMTLRNIAFSGYNASDGQTDSALYFARTGGTVTVSLSGCTGTIKYKSAGATIDLVIDPVDVTVLAIESDGDPIYQAQVFVKCSNATGPFPYQESVTIVNSGTTATVTHTGHGLSTNDYVFVEGASHNQNNGVFQITYISANSYSYTMGSAPGSSPTGTITSTFVLLYGLTDVNGEITMNKTFSSDQPVVGNVRKYGGTPKYKSAPIIGSVDKDLGSTFTAVLVEET